MYGYCQAKFASKEIVKDNEVIDEIVKDALIDLAALDREDKEK